MQSNQIILGPEWTGTAWYCYCVCYTAAYYPRPCTVFPAPTVLLVALWHSTTLAFRLAPCLSKFPVLPCRAAATTIYSFLTNGIITYRSFARSCCVRPASICKEFWQDMGSLQGFTRHPALRLLLQLTTNRTLVQYFFEKAREEVGDHQ
jgi:hypothetical protein